MCVYTCVIFTEYRKSGPTEVPKFLKQISDCSSLQGVKGKVQPFNIYVCNNLPN